MIGPGDGTGGLRAAVYWSAQDDEPGRWWICIVDDDANKVEPYYPNWPSSPIPAPPPLLHRYDALAMIGYAVIEGGSEAWSWKEMTGEDGNAYFFGTAYVRKLNDRERESAGVPPVGR